MVPRDMILMSLECPFATVALRSRLGQQPDPRPIRPDIEMIVCWLFRPVSRRNAALNL